MPFLVWFYHFLWAFLSAVFYGFPSKKIFVIGVTGTKGKTTTLEVINSILEAAGKKTAILSSLRVKIGGDSEKNLSGNTMPGRFFIQRFLSKAVKAGCGYALIEVTSQGVSMSRHRFINWNVGVITNIAPEHIESHGSFEKYRAAKLNFLKYVLKKGGKVFVNKDDKNSEFFVQSLNKEKILLFSKEENLISGFDKESSMNLAKMERSDKLFPSDFNKENVAAAAALAKYLGISDGIIVSAIQRLETVPGRMEFVQREPFTVVVDYAHTPDSLQKLYHSLSAIKAERHNPEVKLICVLGSAGGGRDKWKRPEMGKIAADYCDEIFLTNEDPYDEPPAEIIDQIENGIRLNPRFDSRKFAVHKILDRREAIEKALTLAKKGDIIVISGKGSESFICLDHGKKIPWSDRETVLELLDSMRER